MQYVNSVLDLIGSTPMLKINHFPLPDAVQLFAKLEFANPSGSVKDRMASWVLAKAEAEGRLQPGDTIVEATAGNTGISLALAALNRGYRIVFVVPGKFSEEKQVTMKALGAEIVHTPTEQGLSGAFAKVDELKAELGRVFVADQFENRANPEAHYHSTGLEIYQQLDGCIDYFVAGAGSGGTLTGVMRFLKEKNPRIQGIMADPVGSIIGGGACGSYRIEGIGNDFVPSNLDLELVDRSIKVSDTDAFRRVWEWARREGLIVGSSSGAAFHAALQLAHEVKQGSIVVVLPDRGERYFSQGLFSGL